MIKAGLATITLVLFLLEVMDPSCPFVRVHAPESFPAGLSRATVCKVSAKIPWRSCTEQPPLGKIPARKQVNSQRMHSGVMQESPPLPDLGEPALSDFVFAASYKFIAHYLIFHPPNRA